MSFEIVIAILIAILASLTVGWAIRDKLAKAAPVLPTEVLGALKDLGALKSQVESIANAQAAAQKTLGELHTQMVESTGGVKADLLKEINETRRSLEAFKTEYVARKAEEDKREEYLHTAVKGIEAVIVGGSTRGGSGENVLAEAFQKFPPEMLETDFKVGGKPVEYALVLSNDRRLPIDSKWAATDLLDQLAQTTDAEVRKKLAAKVEEAALKKAAEIEKYIDPRFTVNLAVAAVPDAVFFCCRRAHIQAFRENRVLLMPYSLTIPYLLALFHLYLQHGRSVALENLNDFLAQVEAQMTSLEDIVQNRIAKIHAMAGSSRDDLMSVLANLRIALQQLRALPEAAPEVLPTEGHR